MTFAAGLEARAEAVRYCTVVQARPSAFLPPATFSCAAARAISDGFWNLREEFKAWEMLSGLDREVFYFVATEAKLAAKAWQDAHDGATIPQDQLARAISDAWWALSHDAAHRYTWDGQHPNHRATWMDCALRVLTVGAHWRQRRAAA